MSITEQTTLKETMVQFATFFTNKNAEGIGALLAEDFALFDPALKWIKGKKAVLGVFKKQFNETKHVVYEIINAYEEGRVVILEFIITLDDLILKGVDFIQFDNGKMTELRCYYNPIHLSKNISLNPLSIQAKSMTLGSVYEHYKGKRYKILSVGRHSETLEESIVYQALYGENDVWIRPLAMFLENIVVDGKTKPRFELVHE